MESGKKSKAEVEGIEILDRVATKGVPKQRSCGNNVPVGTVGRW